MAIDSESKRRSAQYNASGTIRPVADGTVGTADRAHAAWHYSGLTYGAPVVATGFPRVSGGGMFSFFRSFARRQGF